MKRVSTTALLTALGATASSTAFADDGWALLEGIEINEIVTDTTYEVQKSFPDSLKDGKDGMKLTGYVMPLTPGETVRELILMSDMGLCPFCGSGGHSASVQVNLAEPLVGIEEGTRVTLQGDMRPVTDPETWQSAILENAVILES